jgi:CRISPR-associated protein Cmr4
MQGALLVLKAQTSLHPGSGAGVGAIDLPVQRERCTNWPMIQGSAVKGVLRDAARDYLIDEAAREGRELSAGKADEDLELVKVFGSPPPKPGEDPDAEASRQEAEGGAEGRKPKAGLEPGSLAVTDARILLFPVRSARGVFAWVTCHAVLERLAADLAMAGRSHDAGAIGGCLGTCCVGDGEALAWADKLSVRVGDDNAPPKVVVEEFLLGVAVQAKPNGALTQPAKWLADALPGPRSNGAPVATVRDHLLVVHHDVFAYLTRYGTEVITRVGLEYEKKVVRDGALFNQELLPPETVLYSVLLTRNGTVPELVKKPVEKAKLLQLGGDETTGKGFCWAGVMSDA